MVKLFVFAVLVFFGLRVWAVGKADVEVDDKGTKPGTTATAVVRGVSCDGSCNLSAADGMLTRDRQAEQQEATNINNKAFEKNNKSKTNTINEQNKDGG